ncbi:TPA: DinI-like family protein [Klebsiella pneumoniae]|nr:DinI-like family protein [Klebsiella pneumoniae]
MIEKNLSCFPLIGATKTEREEIDGILRDTWESADDGFFQ